jgi:hypothetical protein
VDGPSLIGAAPRVGLDRAVPAPAVPVTLRGPRVHLAKHVGPCIQPGPALVGLPVLVDGPASVHRALALAHGLVLARLGPALLAQAV